MNQEIAERTIRTIAKFKEMEADKITVETTIEELEMDSLDALNLVFELEEEFNLTIPDEQVFEMKTVRQMAEGIEKLMAGSNGEEE